ncbi:MAG TPA: hypothetical protein VFY49_13610 [Myxococcota bacterium]|nr:hypothetical protein [Myxococcota bacterium]
MLRRAGLALAIVALASSASAAPLAEWGNGLLPVVRAEASSSGVSLSADAFAVEGYTYNGGRSGSITLSIQLDDPSPLDPAASVFNQVYVLEEPSFDLMAPAALQPSVSQD